MRNHQQPQNQRREVYKRPLARPILICLVTLFVAMLVQPQTLVEALWLFQTPANQTLEQSPVEQQELQQQSEQSIQEGQSTNTGSLSQSSGYGSYGSNLLSIAGIQPSSIASVLNAVGDTGFKYFNIHDQCRNRAACDLGYMLFKKLSFVHNWLIRASVRSLSDMNNIYTQSWLEGMIGKNCTAIYAACRQSPLEGIMNLALLQRLAL